MAGPKLSTAAAAALALAVGACDRLPHWGAEQRGSSAVTVKLPPPRTAAPGFGFDGAQHVAKTELR